MTLAMLVIVFKTNKLLFLIVIVSVGIVIWGLNMLVNKLLNNTGGG